MDKTAADSTPEPLDSNNPNFDNIANYTMALYSRFGEEVSGANELVAFEMEDINQLVRRFLNEEDVDISGVHRLDPGYQIHNTDVIGQGVMYMGSDTGELMIQRFERQYDDLAQTIQEWINLSDVRETTSYSDKYSDISTLE